VALKLIALAQQGKALDLSNLNLKVISLKLLNFSIITYSILKVPLPTFKGLNDTSKHNL
jgi:hypothetical protein